MPISDYMAGLRRDVGTTLLVMPCAAAVVRDEAGRVLLQQRSDNEQWCLPGGALDPGEHPAQACAREIWEETGLVVRPTHVVAVETHPAISYPNGDQMQAVVTTFAATVVGGHLHSRDGESMDLRFFALGDLPASPMLDALVPGVFEVAATGTAFVWEDRWLPPLGDGDEPTEHGGSSGLS